MFSVEHLRHVDTSHWRNSERFALQTPSSLCVRMCCGGCGKVTRMLKVFRNLLILLKMLWISPISLNILRHNFHNCIRSLLQGKSVMCSISLYWGTVKWLSIYFTIMNNTVANVTAQKTKCLFSIISLNKFLEMESLDQRMWASLTRLWWTGNFDASVAPTPPLTTLPFPSHTHWWCLSRFSIFVNCRIIKWCLALI